MALESIFQEISTTQRFQLIVDNLSDTLPMPWYRRYFPTAAPQLTLTYMAVLGESANVAAATVMTRDGETPLRAREALARMQGEIPPLKVMRRLSESQYREFRALQAINVSDETKRNQALKLIWGDVAYVSTAIDKRLDFLVGQGLSTGQLNLDTDNNPDGIVTPTAIDLMMPAGNKKTVAKQWSKDSEALPITDIQNTVQAGREAGKTFGKILMDGTLIQRLLATDQVKNDINDGKATTLDMLNNHLMASGLPIIEQVDFRTQIEKNGTNTTVNPWNVDNAVFVPSGPLGEIRNAIAIEDMAPVQNLVYAKDNGKLISKWRQNEPFREWTKAEYNAIPAFSTILDTYLLQTNTET